MTCSMTLEQTDVRPRDIEQSLTGRSLLPFLYTGVTLANSRSEGMLPVFNNCVKIAFKIGASSWEQCLSTRGWILSGPGDLSASSFCKSI